MQNKVILTLLTVLLLASTASSYTASNSQLNITIYDSYNSYHKSSNNLNITMQPNIQGYNSYSNLNITFAKLSFSQGSQASGSTTTTASTTVAPTTTAQSSGGGGGGGGGGIREIIREIVRDREQPPGQVIREIIREPQIIYKEVLNENPYRLSSVLLAIIMIILLSIRIGDFINQRRKSPYYQYSKMLKKEIKSKLKQGYTKDQILKAAKKAKWPEDLVRDTLDKF